MTDESAEKLERCYLVYALAPPGLRPREANIAFNDYSADDRRGLVLCHDHFVGDRGGFAVFYVAAPEELARLHEPAPLDDWELAVHPLTFSLAPSGFRAQIDFTLDTSRGTTLAKVEAGEQPRRPDWWRRNAGR